MEIQYKVPAMYNNDHLHIYIPICIVGFATLFYF